MSKMIDKYKSDKNTKKQSPIAAADKKPSERENNDEVRKIRTEILSFLEEVLKTTPSGTSAAQMKAELLPVSLPKMLHDRTTDVRKREQQEMEKEAKDFFHFGDIIDGQYRVLAKLKDGGFGQVYKVVDVKTCQEIAVKVEKNFFPPSGEYLERVVLQKFQGHPHCPRLFSSSVMKKYVYVSMQLLGDNLSDIRRACSASPSRLSESAAFRTTIQCLKATEGLHELGFLHRDIKPSNFAVGAKSKQERCVVYMLDFGLCRYFKNRDGTVKPPRDNVGFRGTVRYASLVAHEKKELCRKDDLTSLFYSFVEYLTGQLPWRKTNEKDKVAQMKNRYSPQILSQVFPKEVGDFVQLVEAVKYTDKPNYAAMVTCLTQYLPTIPATLNDPYDWELSDCSTLRHWRPQQSTITTSSASSKN